MQQDMLTCPGCGAPIASASSPATGETAVRCGYCGWRPPAEPAASLPSPEERFRMLTTESTAQPDDLLEQLPEEARVLLAGRLRPDAPGAAAEFREDTLRSLRGMGYAVTEDSHGSRISATPRSGSPASPLSPLDVVRIAAEQEGGVQPRTKLPVCPKCQAASPLGSTKCQWCGEPLPTAQVP